MNLIKRELLRDLRKNLTTLPNISRKL